MVLELSAEKLYDDKRGSHRPHSSLFKINLQNLSRILSLNLSRRGIGQASLHITLRMERNWLFKAGGLVNLMNRGRLSEILESNDID